MLILKGERPSPPQESGPFISPSDQLQSSPDSPVNTTLGCSHGSYCICQDMGGSCARNCPFWKDHSCHLWALGTASLLTRKLWSHQVCLPGPGTAGLEGLEVFAHRERTSSRSSVSVCPGLGRQGTLSAIDFMPWSCCSL